MNIHIGTFWNHFISKFKYLKKKVSTVDFKTTLWSPKKLDNTIPEGQIFYFFPTKDKTNKYYCKSDKIICPKQIWHEAKEVEKRFIDSRI